MQTEQSLSAANTAARQLATTPRARPNDAAEQRAIGLGWASLSLGVAQVLAPGAVAQLIGTSDSALARGTMRVFGLREIAAGFGILRQPRPNLLLWLRVAGDIVDLAMLTQQLTSKRSRKTRLALATAATVGATVLDLKSALDATRARRGQDTTADGIHVKQSITIRATPGQVYGFWRDLENLPKFMRHLESVKVYNGKSLWSAKAPGGTTVEWVAEFTEDRPNSRIAWRSLPGSSIPNHGSVRFESAPGNQGTEVHVELFYEPPAGALGSLVAKLFGEEPKQQIKSDLRRLKQVLETGEVLHSDASVHRGRHPAQPSSETTGYPEQLLHAAGNSVLDRALANELDQSPTSARPRFSAPPPQKPPSHVVANDEQRTSSSDAPNDAIPYTHFTNQGSGATHDDDAS